MPNIKNHRDNNSSIEGGSVGLNRTKGDDPQNDPPPQTFVMPEGWQPGMPIIVPDPSDPTGKRMIEIPAD